MAGEAVADWLIREGFLLCFSFDSASASSLCFCNRRLGGTEAGGEGMGSDPVLGFLFSEVR